MCIDLEYLEYRNLNIKIVSRFDKFQGPNSQKLIINLSKT